MKWWHWMPLSSFTECWILSSFFTLFFHFHQKALQFLFTFCHKSGVLCISWVTDISPGSLDSSLCFIYNPGIIQAPLHSVIMRTQCDHVWKENKETSWRRDGGLGSQPGKGLISVPERTGHCYSDKLMWQVSNSSTFLYSHSQSHPALELPNIQNRQGTAPTSRNWWCHSWPARNLNTCQERILWQL